MGEEVEAPEAALVLRVRAGEPRAFDELVRLHLGREPDVAAAKAEERDRLERAMLELPERQRLIVKLFDLEGFSSVEIGAMLGMADGTVRWHLLKARERLRRTLAPMEEWHR